MPSPIWDEFTLYAGRELALRLRCYEADEETQLVVEASDVFRFKIWDTDGSPPDVDIDSIGAASAAFTADNATDVLTSAGHELSNGDTVHLVGDDLPAGLSAATRYFVITATTNTFQLSLTRGGAAIDFSDDGSGTRTWFKCSHITVETVGVASTTPATVLVEIGQVDTASLTPGDYEGELALVDDSDNDAIKTIARGRIRIEGSATGDVGLT